MNGLIDRLHGNCRPDSYLLVRRRETSMNAAEWWLKVSVLTLSLLLGASEMAVARVASTDSPTAASCAAPPYRQFDFWVGDWDAGGA